jgi:uncharacterized protein DUF4190
LSDFPPVPPAGGASSPLYCRHCGGPLLADAAFCTNCGKSTAEAQTTPPPQGAPPPPAPPGYPPPGYPPPPGEYAGYVPYPVPMQQKTNGFSIASLVLGIIWIYWIGSILALIFGYIAKSQIDGSQGTQGGRGMAIAGIVLGWVGVGILILFIVLGIIGAVSAPGP